MRRGPFDHKETSSWANEEAFEYFGFTTKGFSVFNSVYSERMLAKSDLQGLTLTTSVGVAAAYFCIGAQGCCWAPTTTWCDLSADAQLRGSIPVMFAATLTQPPKTAARAMKASGGHDSTAKILSNAYEDTWKHVVAPQCWHKYNRNRTCPSNSGPKQVTHPSAIVRQSLLLHGQMCLLIEQLLDTMNRCEGRHLVGP